MAEPPDAGHGGTATRDISTYWVVMWVVGEASADPSEADDPQHPAARDLDDELYKALLDRRGELEEELTYASSKGLGPGFAVEIREVDRSRYTELRIAVVASGDAIVDRERLTTFASPIGAVLSTALTSFGEVRVEASWEDTGLVGLRTSPSLLHHDIQRASQIYASMAAMLSGFAFAVLALLLSADPRRVKGDLVPDPHVAEQAVEVLIVASIGCAVIGFTFAVVVGEDRRTARPQAMAFYAGTGFVVAIANLLLAVALVTKAFLKESAVHTVVAVGVIGAYSVALVFMSLSPIFIQTHPGAGSSGPSWAAARHCMGLPPQSRPWFPASSREWIARLWRRPWAPFVLRHLPVVIGVLLWLFGAHLPLWPVLIVSGLVIYGGALTTLLMSLRPQYRKRSILQPEHPRLQAGEAGSVEAWVRKRLGPLWELVTAVTRRGSEVPAAATTAIVLGLLITQLPQ